MKKGFPVFLLLMLSSFYLFAQTRQSIRLLNEETKLPVTSAVVTSPDKSFNRLSDETGKINLSALQATSISISSVGYLPATILLADIPADGKVWLTPTITSLEAIQVNAAARTGIFHTISDLDIHLRPLINSQEVLRIVPGLFMGQHAGGGKAEQIFLRGFDIDHGTDIQINVDGMPVNMVSHAHGQGYADLHFVIPELIEKVNFNKGPYFADKGNFATAGFVEFKTKDYLENSFIKVEGGQFDTYRAVTAINLLNKNAKEKNQSLYLAGEASYTKGYFESPQDFNRFNGLLKYHGKISNRSSFTSYISGFNSKWDASGQIPDRAVADGSIGFYGAIDDTEGGKTSRYNFNNTLITNFNNGLRWKNHLYYSQYNFELYSNFTFFLENPVDGDQIKQKEERNMAGFNSTIEKEHNLGNKKASFQAGIQSRFDKTNNSELSSTKNRNQLLNPIKKGDVREMNIALFAEEKIKANSILDITLGVRGDYFANKYKDNLLRATNSSNSFILSPKLNFNYRLNNKVQLYWYNGQGFHSNDTRVAVQQNGRDVVTPAWGSDLGGIFKLGRKAVFQTAFWYLWMKQEFVYVGDAGVVEPGGKTQRMGWDASLRYEIIPSLYADIDLNYTNPRALDVPKGEDNLPLAPKFTSTGGFTYRKATGWNGSLRYRLMGDRPANEDNSVKAKGYFICDAAINFTKKKWEAGISLQNIFNSRWKETQFDTESRLQNEPAGVSEIHFTPGTPFFGRMGVTLFF
ncbi:MAG: TonB-dependent receptor plug domain-containing protein [Rhizobacter sp.]|nr:TonB-dependent receptor plug domain-containing protein [Ferruginibacter sp.]